MFSPRLLKILGTALALLTALVVGYLYLQVPKRSHPYTQAIKTANAISLQEGAQTLQFKKNGNAWRVLSSKGASLTVDEDRMKSLLSSLEDLQLEDVISERPAAADDFEVNASCGTRITVTGAAGASAQGLFGKQAPDFTHIYFRYPDRPQIYLGRGVIRGTVSGTSLSSWRPKSLVDVAEANVQGVRLEQRDSIIEVTLSSGSWHLNGKEIDPAPVYGILGSVAHLRAEDWQADDASPMLTYDDLRFAKVTLKTQKDSTELRIGRLDPKTKRYPVSVGPDTGVAWVSEQRFATVLLKPSAFKPK